MVYCERVGNRSIERDAPVQRPYGSSSKAELAHRLVVHVFKHDTSANALHLTSAFRASTSKVRLLGGNAGMM